MKQDDRRTAVNNFRRIHAGMEHSISRFFLRTDLTAAQGHLLLYILTRPHQRLCSTELDRLAARTETQIFDGFSPQEIEALLCFQMRILQNLNKEEHLDGNRSQSNTTI